MDLLIAIALLCQTNVGLDKRGTTATQLKCQQEYLKCYFGLAPAEQVTETSKVKKLLAQCVLDRK